MRSDILGKGKDGVQALPVTNVQWLEFLEREDDTFRHLLKTASDDRRSIGKRLEPMCEGLDAAERLLPVVTREQPEWCKPLIDGEPGIYAISFGDSSDDKVVVFSVCLKGEVWYLRLAVEGHEIGLDLDLILCDDLKHVSALSAIVGESEVEIYRIDVRYVEGGERAGMIVFRVVATENVEAKKKTRASAPRKASAPVTDDEEDHSDIESSDAESSDSDAESVISGADVEMEEEAEEREAAGAGDMDGGDGELETDGGDLSEESDADRDGAAKAAAYTYTDKSVDGYVSFTLHPRYHDTKVRILQRWHKYFEGPFSKTVTIAHYDAVPERPIRSRLMLRAWVVYRLRDDAFLSLNAARRAWHSAEEASVIAAFKKSKFPQCGGLGSDRAIAFLVEWLPQVLD